jgi:hypothetical protein
MQEILTTNMWPFCIALTISSLGIAASTSVIQLKTVRGISASFLVILGICSIGACQFLTGNTGFFGGPNLMLSTITGLLTAILLITLFSIVAARRLYEPTNRLFNYRQFTILMMLILGGLASFTVYQENSPYFPSMPADFLPGMIFLYFTQGWIINLVAVMIFSSGRIERGDEVWQIRNRFSFFRVIHEQVCYALFVASWIIPPMMSDNWSSVSTQGYLMMEYAPRYQRPVFHLVPGAHPQHPLCRQKQGLSDRADHTDLSLAASPGHRPGPGKYVPRQRWSGHLHCICSGIIPRQLLTHL